VNPANGSSSEFLIRRVRPLELAYFAAHCVGIVA
jgi:hypothetical protein